MICDCDWATRTASQAGLARLAVLSRATQQINYTRCYWQYSPSFFLFSGMRQSAKKVEIMYRNTEGKVEEILAY